MAQCLLSLGATNLRKSEKESAKAVSSLQVNKKGPPVLLLVEGFCIIFQKYFLQSFRLSLVLTLLLICHQISGSYSYKIVLVENEFTVFPLKSAQGAHLKVSLPEEAVTRGGTCLQIWFFGVGAFISFRRRTDAIFPSSSE